MKTLNAFSMFFALMLLISPQANAQDEMTGTSATFGDYTVHYSTFNTSFLTPDVAKSVGVVRSKRKGMMTIAVLKKNTEGKESNASASVTGSAYDLIVTKNLDFKQVREQNAVYYLATFDIENKIDVYFTVNVQPDPNQDPFVINFKKRLYWDE
ncbi:Uncharacterised protein [BD1-7 clade bacterium]|uniref:DUF4426 domain-containing protein n=1 Tax=BD1-7 clade bacterium TaxID=2029982 RepID=A0A5S9MZZ8_9GAMM|nr:Uncharacterised protein [BD1-7 clade bacterium]CAA0082769.1 Uncharacterised protein [BD1-7 clade bacterium]